MDVNAHITRRLALLPDDTLMRLLNAVHGGGEKQRCDDHAPRNERVEVIIGELHARGIFGPPWWSGTKR